MSRSSCCQRLLCTTIPTLNLCNGFTYFLVLVMYQKMVTRPVIQMLTNTFQKKSKPLFPSHLKDLKKTVHYIASTFRQVHLEDRQYVKVDLHTWGGRLRWSKVKALLKATGRSRGGGAQYARCPLVGGVGNMELVLCPL